MPWRERAFVVLGRIAERLPAVRGKTRAVLLVFRWLDLEKRHVAVAARLRKPIAFDAQLDLHAWLQRVAFLTGGYEPETVRLLADLHRRSGRSGPLLDIGANIGLIAIPFARMVGRVVAVEAVPDNVAALRTNIARNALADAIHVIPFGLGAAPATVDIQVEGDLEAGEGSGTANILPDGSQYECVRQQIVIRTLDELLDAGEVPPACPLMKIDTDGYDLKVLEGGRRFLALARPAIFGEFAEHCLGWHGQSVRDVVAFAAANGYETWLRVGRAYREIAPADFAKYTQDLLLVPRELVPRFEHLRRM